MQISSVSRRFVPGAASALALALVLGGCGAPGSDSAGGAEGSSASQASSLLPQAEGATQYPLVLTSPWGETTLDKRPERIAVVTSDFDPEYLSMLKATPVFAPEDVMSNVWMNNAFPQKVENLKKASGDEPPYEAIAASRPDVIVATAFADKEQYDRLRKIAPVVSVGGKDGTEDPDETWQDRLTRVGEALDLKSAAEREIQNYDQRLAAVREDHPEFEGKTISYPVYYGTEDVSFMNSTGDTSEQVFSAMGFAKNPNSEKFVQDPTVSNEQLGLLDADVMLMSDNSVSQSGESSSSLNTVTDLQLFKNLPVVKNGRVVYLSNHKDSYTVDGKTHEGNVAFAMAHSGPLAQAWAAEQLAPYLSEALQK
ncbi:ABC transporter substrate-binding protein [Kocuria sp.]|uniref:ABC transporter substrate-binding protein n=1 Tax=Kocuria sp. TaxID=1871328 RepID=UPI0026DAF271|nr:ABC transporter substrate-binding protein [Kocuria sp.]MDO4920142.1 ABC transporter substrate-binding protein [Kocuria sp.]